MRRWCSHVCVLRYKIAKGDQGACRSWLRTDWLDPKYPLRDPFVCAACSIDLSERAIEARVAADLDAAQLPCGTVRHQWGRMDAQRAHQWEADHIVPLVEGGPHAPENLRALCRPCHLRETRALRARMAAARRAGGPGA